MDDFFWHGQNPLLHEIEEDVKLVVLQPIGTLYYDRGYGGNVSRHENAPDRIALEIEIRADVVTAISVRNSRVSDGRGGLPDRRVLVSQEMVGVESLDDSIELTVGYIPMAAGAAQTVSLGISGV